MSAGVRAFGHTNPRPTQTDYHHEPTNTSHFWEIPSKALAEYGYFTKTTGKESITLYGCPVAKQPNPNAKRKADTWTSAFYTGELKHA